MVRERDADPIVGTVEARAGEHVLREAVDDLKAEVQDLRAQRDAIAAICERLQLGAPGGAPPAAAGGISAPSPPTGGAAALRAVGKRAIRGTLGALRRVWRFADPGQRYVVAVRPAPEPAVAPPAVTVVVVEERAAGGIDRLRELGRQTAGRLEVAVWDRGRGTVALRSARGGEIRRAEAGSRDELVAAARGAYLVSLPAGARSLPSTLFEVLQWLVSSEDLTYVRVLSSPSEDDDDLAHELLLCRREVWHPDGVDLGALAEIAVRRPVLGKTVGLAGRLDSAVPRLATLGPGSERLVCRTGRYDVWSGNRAGPILHRVRPLPTDTDAGAGARPSLLVLVGAPVAGGAAGVLAASVRELRDVVRVVVATTSADHAPDVRRALQLERLGATVYDLGSTLQPEVWPTAIDRIAGRTVPGAVLAVGRDPRLDPVIARLQASGVRVVALPAADGAAVTGADVMLVADAVPDVAGEKGGGTPRLVPVPAGWLLPDGRPAVSRELRGRIRDELRVAGDRWLVLTVADLVADARPEDVVVVADRLRQEPFEFVLVGDGALAGSVRDLGAFLGVDALRLREPRHPIEELVAAADVVLDPSFEPVVRPSLAAALAAGTPVVTAPGGGAERLIAEIGGGIVVSCVGDPLQLAAALLQVRTSGLRPSPERARAVLARQRQVTAASIRHLVLGALDAAPAE